MACKDFQVFLPVRNLICAHRGAREANNPDILEEAKDLRRRSATLEQHREVYDDLLARLARWQKPIDDPVLRQVRLNR